MQTSSAPSSENQALNPLRNAELKGAQLRGEIMANGTHRILTGPTSSQKLVVCVAGLAHYSFTWLGLEERFHKAGYVNM